MVDGGLARVEDTADGDLAAFLLHVHCGHVEWRHGANRGLNYFGDETGLLDR